MELQQAEQMARELMRQHGLSGWRFRFDHARRRFGYCVRGTFTISLSRNLTLLNKETDVRDVILHEIAHALVGSGHGHDRVWKRKALEIGCDGKRCYGEHVALPPKRWRVRCPNCGATCTRNRRSSNRAACTPCCQKHNGGKWHPNFIMVYEPNAV